MPAVVRATLPLIGAWRGDRQWMGLAQPAAWGQFAFLGFSFACLTYAFMVDDFSVAYVAHNSNSALPRYYKFSAVWGAHEGSLLLWAFILAGWTFAVAIFSRQLPEDMLARVLGVMGLISIGFLLFLIVTSNPFERLLPQVPMDGRDLNPLLQDFGLIVHPRCSTWGTSVSRLPSPSLSPRCSAGVWMPPGRAGPVHGRWWPGRSSVWASRWVLVGLLRAWLGWLVVLGPGGKCLVHALAGRYRVDPLAGRYGEARRLQELDGAAGDRGLLVEPARHLPRPLRCTSLPFTPSLPIPSAACSSWCSC